MDVEQVKQIPYYANEKLMDFIRRKKYFSNIYNGNVEVNENSHHRRRPPPVY
jgi:hypothetical protein